LSIKPEYAERIFSGQKKYEFRRAIFKNRNVTHVVVYASAPIRKVIGEFQVINIIHDDVRALWDETGSAAGIPMSKFFDYFFNRDEGYAIEIGKAQKYEHSFSLEEVYGLTPPQSFVYLK